VSERRRRDRLLLALVYAGLAVVLAHAHAVNVDQPNEARKLARHAAVLTNAERDPYQYKLFAITWAVEGLHSATGIGVFPLYLANLGLSLFALLLAHHLWLARLYGTREALLGTFLLAALAHGLFLGYHHHPYDLWGVAGYCLLLSAAGRAASTPALCGLALATGLVWEKHALVPVLDGVRRLREGEPLPRTALRSGAVLGCALAVPVAVRLLLGTDREKVDVTSLAEQDWGKVAAHHLPLLLPFAAVLVLAWADVPRWVRVLWLAVPLLFAAYLSSRFLVDELRSFWAFVPVFTATVAAWARRLPSGADPAGG
jgi:hypothetical protein